MSAFLSAQHGGGGWPSYTTDKEKSEYDILTTPQLPVQCYAPLGHENMVNSSLVPFYKGRCIKFIGSNQRKSNYALYKIQTQLLFAVPIDNFDTGFPKCHFKIKYKCFQMLLPKFYKLLHCFHSAFLKGKKKSTHWI